MYSMWRMVAHAPVLPCAPIRPHSMTAYIVRASACMAQYFAIFYNMCHDARSVKGCARCVVKSIRELHITRANLNANSIHIWYILKEIHTRTQSHVRLMMLFPSSTGSYISLCYVLLACGQIITHKRVPAAEREMRVNPGCSHVFAYAPTVNYPTHRLILYTQTRKSQCPHLRARARASGISLGRAKMMAIFRGRQAAPHCAKRRCAAARAVRFLVRSGPALEGRMDSTCDEATTHGAEWSGSDTDTHTQWLGGGGLADTEYDGRGRA